MENGATTMVDVQGQGIYSMYEEVVAELAQLKRKPLSSAQEVSFVILRTVMPLIRDLAHYVRENRVDIDQLLEQSEGSDETQFTEEDARDFDVALQFARGTLEAALTTVPEGSEEKAKLQALLGTVTRCIGVVESAPIVGDAVDGDGVDEGGEQAEEPAKELS